MLVVLAVLAVLAMLAVLTVLTVLAMLGSYRHPGSPSAKHSPAALHVETLVRDEWNGAVVNTAYAVQYSVVQRSIALVSHSAAENVEHV